jgi:hypothetical protein
MDCFNCKFPDCIRDERADINEQKREWARKNPEKRKAIRRRYYLNHREQEMTYQKNYYSKVKNLPEYKAMKREAQRKYRERVG